jgi:hypothetical protein
MVGKTIYGDIQPKWEIPANGWQMQIDLCWGSHPMNLLRRSLFAITPL